MVDTMKRDVLRWVHRGRATVTLRSQPGGEEVDGVPQQLGRRLISESHGQLGLIEKHMEINGGFRYMGVPPK